jgi:hypothetical protein
MHLEMFGAHDHLARRLCRRQPDEIRGGEKGESCFEQIHMGASPRLQIVRGMDLTFGTRRSALQ